MISRILNLDRYKLIIFCIIIFILSAYLGSKFILLFSEDKAALTNSLFIGKSLNFIFIVAVIIVPLIETFIFQFCIIEFFLLIGNKTKFIYATALLVSSLAFGLSHSFNVVYIIYGTFLGLILSLFYLLAKKRKDINSFFLTFVAHASSNMFVFFINEIL